jgi:linearmycin/streptolysin S transport system permease protein
MLTLLRIGRTNLSRDRVAQALTFLLPIIFFSIFAMVFGRQSNALTSSIRVAVVDEDHSELSRRMIADMQKEASLRLRISVEDGGPPMDRQAAERLVRNGDVPVAVVIPSGLEAAFEKGSLSSTPSLTLLADPSDPVAPNMVGGLLQKVTMTAAPDLIMRGGIRQFETYAGQLTPQQRAAVDAWMPTLRSRVAGGTSAGGSGTSGTPLAGVGVKVVDVMRSGQQGAGSLISFYAAGIGVMFLLFSTVGQAGGVLLDEVESGTFERLLSTNMTMSGILIAKWAFLAIVGFLQLCVMFLWGRVAFGLPLFSHLPGFFVMTAFTAAAAAGLGMMLATIARSRAQLSGFSTILILTMSALGGSMFPRFLMSEGMQRVGLITFNAWALDGYLKVFWRDAAIWQLWPQVAVLLGLAVVFLSVARLFARRWEAV